MGSSSIAGRDDFFCSQTGSGAHIASYPASTDGSLHGGTKRSGRASDHSSTSRAEAKNG
jgi:hypothetical protein